MRRDLRRVLVHTRGKVPDSGLFDGDVEPEPLEPTVAELRTWWELGKVLIALLGTEVNDPGESAPVAAATPTPTRRRVDFGPK